MICIVKLDDITYDLLFTINFAVSERGPEVQSQPVWRLFGSGSDHLIKVITMDPLSQSSYVCLFPCWSEPLLGA